MITLIVAVICLVIGLVGGTAIQVAYPSHPKEMWNAFKLTVNQYMQGFNDIEKKVKEHNESKRR